MENVKHCAVLVRRAEDVWEGTRTALGLAAHNYWVCLFVLKTSVEMTAALRENLDWLTEMECPYFSDLKENAVVGFKYLPLAALAAKLREMDLVIPFGDRDERF